MDAWYGKQVCEGVIKSTGKPCTNRAYYKDGGCLKCGVHSNKNTREKLPKNPNAQKEREEMLENRQLLVDKTTKKNKEEGKRGDVICTKLMMMKEPDHYDGYLKVFPNFKHGNRSDGFGCPSLSPKSLGPINHHMRFPDGTRIPKATNLENYHQFAKVFMGEMSKDDKISEKCLELRKLGYEDKTPYRHKFEHPNFPDVVVKGNKNIPLFSVYYNKQGEERRFTYIQSRYFYCYWYEKLVKKEEDYKKLCKLLKDGTNLQIIGYDGYPVIKDLYLHYLDPKRPFGHEMVLLSMLVLKKQDYPWRVYYKSNEEIYRNII